MINIIRDNGNYDVEIKTLVHSAFQQHYEVVLVDNIKKSAKEYVSYIALDDGKVIGHVLISPMLLNDKEIVLTLVPVSVSVDYRNQGIGEKLIKKAIEDAVKLDGYDFMTVLGSEHYYARFGFSKYDKRQFMLPFSVEDRFYQILVLNEDAFNDIKGILKYPHYFEI